MLGTKKPPLRKPPQGGLNCVETLTLMMIMEGLFQFVYLNLQIQLTVTIIVALLNTFN